MRCHICNIIIHKKKLDYVEYFFLGGHCFGYLQAEISKGGLRHKSDGGRIRSSYRGIQIL